MVIKIGFLVNEDCDGILTGFMDGGSTGCTVGTIEEERMVGALEVGSEVASTNGSSASSTVGSDDGSNDVGGEVGFKDIGNLVGDTEGLRDGCDVTVVLTGSKVDAYKGFELVVIIAKVGVRVVMGTLVGIDDGSRVGCMGCLVGTSVGLYKAGESID